MTCYGIPEWTTAMRLKVRSMVGLLPLCAHRAFFEEEWIAERYPAYGT